MASARPPRVIRFIVWPVIQSANRAAAMAIGMFRTMTTALRQSLRKIRTITPISPAPSRPSMPTASIAVVTVGDWSNSKLTRMSSGRTACMSGRASLTFRTTERVEASARFVTRM
jgi:hypothetical protein